LLGGFAARCSLLAARFSRLAARWSLLAGRWSLVAGRGWLLAAGCWLAVMDSHVDVLVFGPHPDDYQRFIDQRFND
jgi:hypothetical protein